MILFLYNFALLLVLLAGAPYWLFRVLTQSKYREGLRERVCGASKRLEATSGDERTIWVHAVSVGEVLAVSQLVEEVKALAPGYRVVISTTTRTGQALAQARFGAGRCFYFPLDLPWAVRRSLRRINPAILVLAESEFWPNLLHRCKRAGVAVVVVNARISDRSLPRYVRLKRLWRPFLDALTRVLAQSGKDAERFVQIGVPAARVEVVGNLKFDVRPPVAVKVVELLRAHLAESARVLVCGSTLEGEEAMLLDAWPAMCRDVPGAVMVLAPRHPERFARVTELLSVRNLSFVRRSEWMESPRQIMPGSVFLLDSIGELAAVYALGSVAFVGGSLVAAGGHNPLEPAQFGVATVIGEHYENFRGIVDLLRAHEAIELTAPATLGTTLASLLMQVDTADALGARARAVFEGEAGATARTVTAILQVLRKDGAAA